MSVMKSISLKEMQEIELQLLLEFDKVCKKNSLRYYMDGGTLLGAMCYQGFIPWDDDIDLKMPRPDYERLMEMQQEFPETITLDVPRQSHCEYTMTKLIDNRTILIEKGNQGNKATGVYIDIFPMDGYPLKKDQWDTHIQRLQKLNTMFHYSLEGFNTLKQSTSMVSRFKGYIYSVLYDPWKLYVKLTETAKQYDYDTADYVGLLVEGNPDKERFQKDWFQDGFTLEFEGYRIPAPIGYKRHLEIFYGEHVTNPEYDHNLPMIPSNHEHEVYWKE